MGKGSERLCCQMVFGIWKIALDSKSPFSITVLGNEMQSPNPVCLSKNILSSVFAELIESTKELPL